MSCAAGAMGLRQGAPDARPSSNGQSVSQNNELLRKDVETMRRVLDREIGGDRARGSRSANVLFLSGSSSAYYAPGNGFIYIGSVNAVLAGANASEAAKEKPKDPSLWDDVRAEVDGRPVSRRGGKTVKFDAQRADEIKERAIKALGKYAVNMAQMKESDMLTLILKGSPGFGFDSLLVNDRLARIDEFNNHSDSKNGSDEKAADDEKDKAPKKPDSDADAEEMTQNHDNGFTYITSPFDGSAASTQMTLTAKRADCVAFSEGKLDYNSFAAKVQVGQFVGSGHYTNTIYTTNR